MPSGSVKSDERKDPEDEETITELCLRVADRRRGGTDERLGRGPLEGRKPSARNLLAGAHVARVVARPGVRGIEPADAPVETSGDRNFEGMGKHPFAQLIVAADIAAHEVVSLIIDLRLQRSIRIDDAGQ